MADFKTLDDTIQRNLQTNLGDLNRLCAQPSIAAQNIGMVECAELTVGLLRARGFEMQIMPAKGFPVVYAERKGQTDRTLLFHNHYDVQPPEPLELWDSLPFEPTVRDGKMFARGVSDDKGHIICRLAAIVLLH